MQQINLNKKFLSLSISKDGSSSVGRNGGGSLEEGGQPSKSNSIFDNANSNRKKAGWTTRNENKG